MTEQDFVQEYVIKHGFRNEVGVIDTGIIDDAVKYAEELEKRGWFQETDGIMELIERDLNNSSLIQEIKLSEEEWKLLKNCGGGLIP